ncbi:MAG: DUF3500 domain-containing protein [Candidatus Hydrogenedentes bacterium]|nr:DUF3500 domain-containing protein [Candidatus Hydrogenedentota bacterium]
MRHFFALCCLLATAGATHASPITEAVAALRAGLDATQQQKLCYPFEADERLTWIFVPHERNGFSMNGLDETQTQLFLNVLRAITSRQGFETAETIRSLEVLLNEIEQGKGPKRDALYYFITVFGEPSDTETWSLRFEGHHMSMHWVFIDGKAYSSTPQFLGSNPGTVREGVHKGTRPLGPSEDLALALINALPEAQRAKATVDPQAPRDILSGTEPGPIVPEKTGIPYNELDAAHQKQLMEVLQFLAAVQRPDFYDARMERVKSDLDNVTFTWMGGLKDGEAHYYRIQGTKFLVEYDNIQNGANHIHTVWRDMTADFGADMLKEHYTAVPHERSPYTALNNRK